jgi:uncharacterized membrane protein YdjX (TVP38/TMEM64 family)
MRLLSEDVTTPRVAAELLVATAVAAAVLYAVYRYAPFLYDVTAMRQAVESVGPWGPVAFVALQAVQVVVAPIPGSLTAVAGGYLFGWWGLAFSLVGVTIGSAVAFWLARRFGRPYVERIADTAALERFDAVLGETGDVGVFVVFLVPGLPDDVVCFLAGLTPIRLRRLVGISLVARFPGFLLANSLGTSLATRALPEALVVLAVLVASSVLGYRYRDRVVEWLERRT